MQGGLCYVHVILQNVNVCRISVWDKKAGKNISASHGHDSIPIQSAAFIHESRKYCNPPQYSSRIFQSPAGRPIYYMYRIFVGSEKGSIFNSKSTISETP